MNREDLFNEFKSWLEHEEICFRGNPEDAGFEMPMRGDEGEWQVWVTCEEKPAMLQVVCRLPARVPEAKLAEAALLLHNLNSRLRVGAFCLNPESRTLSFRLPMRIHAEMPFPEQFKSAFATAFGIFDEQFRALAFFACSTPEAREAVAKLRPKAHSDTTDPRCPGSSRLELN